MSEKKTCESTSHEVPDMDRLLSLYQEASVTGKEHVFESVRKAIDAVAGAEAAAVKAMVLTRAAESAA